MRVQKVAILTITIRVRILRTLRPRPLAVMSLKRESTNSSLRFVGSCVSLEIRDSSSRSHVSFCCGVMISSKATCVQPCCRAMKFALLRYSCHPRRGGSSVSMHPCCPIAWALNALSDELREVQNRYLVGVDEWNRSLYKNMVPGLCTDGDYHCRERI